MADNKKSWMLSATDPARAEIVKRAKALGITGEPDKACHSLGTITLEDGREVNAHVVHAVDPIITDGDELVLINRLKDPGKGLPALPGGLIDPLKGGGLESGVAAGAREAMEEVSIDLGNIEGKPIGTRNFDRPFDIRVAQGNGLEEKYGIKDGEPFLVSTQAVRYDVPDLAKTDLVAGDDAEPGSARRVKLNDLSKEGMGVGDHYDMIVAAMPEKFPTATRAAEQATGWKNAL